MCSLSHSLFTSSFAFDLYLSSFSHVYTIFAHLFWHLTSYLLLGYRRQILTMHPKKIDKFEKANYSVVIIWRGRLSHQPYFTSDYNNSIVHVSHFNTKPDQLHIDTTELKKAIVLARNTSKCIVHFNITYYVKVVNQGQGVM